MSRDFDPGDPAVAFAHRVLRLCKAEFADDDQLPRFVVVVETPPVGEIVVVRPMTQPRIGIASTGDDEIDTHRMLALAAGAIRSGMSESTKAQARMMWQTLRAGFERRQ